MPEKSLFRQLLEASSVGLNLVISTIIGGLMGYGLDYAMDRWFGIKTAPWLLFVFAIFGKAIQGGVQRIGPVFNLGI